jgi:predicted HTH domain antitoxin
MKYTFRHREAEWNEAVAISLFNEKKGEIASSSRMLSSRIFSGLTMTVFAFMHIISAHPPAAALLSESA